MKFFAQICLISFFIVIVSFPPVSAAKKVQAAPPEEPRRITDFTKKNEPAKTEVKEEKPAEAEAAPAAEAPREQNPFTYDEPKSEEPSMGWMFLKTIIVLGIFGAGFYFFFKYVKKKTGMSGVGQGAAQILAVVSLGQNKFLQIVDLGGRLLILGVSDAGVNLVSEVRERDEIDRLRLLSSKSSPMQQQYGFQDFISEHVGSLIDYIGRKRAGHKQKKDISSEEIYSAEYIDEERIDYLKTQRERLRRINGHNDNHEK